MEETESKNIWNPSQSAAVSDNEDIDLLIQKLRNLHQKMRKVRAQDGMTESEEHRELDQERTLQVRDLLALRYSAKQRKDFTRADMIRDGLSGLGIHIKDTADGGANWTGTWPP